MAGHNHPKAKEHASPRSDERSHSRKTEEVPETPAPAEDPLTTDSPGVIRVVSIEGRMLIARRGKDALEVNIPVNHIVPEVGSEIKIKTLPGKLILA